MECKSATKIQYVNKDQICKHTFCQRVNINQKSNFSCVLIYNKPQGRQRRRHCPALRSSPPPPKELAFFSNYVYDTYFTQNRDNTNFPYLFYFCAGCYFSCWFSICTEIYQQSPGALGGNENWNQKIYCDGCVLYGIKIYELPRRLLTV